MSEATYELRLRGPVSTRTLSTFEEMDMRADTIISGTVHDDAALHRLLERIDDLGFEIVEVHQACDKRDARHPVTAFQTDRFNPQGDN
jgi:hypothetical protein